MCIMHMKKEHFLAQVCVIIIYNYYFNCDGIDCTTDDRTLLTNKVIIIIIATYNNYN